jgi:hypothetical protein
VKRLPGGQVSLDQPAQDVFSVQPGSVNRRSRREGATVDVPATALASSPPSAAIRRPVVRGWRASRTTHRTVDASGVNRRSGPSAASTSRASSGAACSAASISAVETTLLAIRSSRGGRAGRPPPGAPAVSRCVGRYDRRRVRPSSPAHKVPVRVRAREPMAVADLAQRCTSALLTMSERATTPQIASLARRSVPEVAC